MKKIFYEKIGRKYVPVSEYDSNLLDAFPKGNHMVMIYPGGSSRRYNVDPNYAAMIAAGRIAEDVMTKAIFDASEFRSSKRRETPLTLKQKEAWNNLVEAFGDDARYLNWASAHDVVQAGLKAMQEEAIKLMQHESVKQAYDHFQLVCELCAEKETDD